eukprot:m.58290 g.58290  ORF g.58290 m.58290 type:complete len:98 (-) comp11676_c0_seq1:69-362(-)
MMRRMRRMFMRESMLTSTHTLKRMSLLNSLVQLVPEEEHTIHGELACTQYHAPPPTLFISPSVKVLKLFVVCFLCMLHTTYPYQIAFKHDVVHYSKR